MKVSLSGIFLVLLLSFPLWSSASVDSVGTEIVEGSTYILHQVEQSEGFYGIARKYKVSVAELQAANPREGNALKLGEVIRVPYNKKPAAPAQIITNTHNEEPKKENPAIEKNNTPDTYQAKLVHKVQHGETLFSIAKKYGVTVAQIKEWNHITSNNISLGQQLSIQKPTVQIPLSTETNTTASSGGIKRAPEGNIALIEKPNPYENSVEKTENGMASWINDKNLNPQKSIALHKTAPIGTIIRVTNKMNNKSIYVKVIGTLPETGDNTNTIIVLSKAAAGMLDVRDPKFQVTLNYSIPKE